MRNAAYFNKQKLDDKSIDDDKLFRTSIDLPLRTYKMIYEIVSKSREKSNRSKVIRESVKDYYQRNVKEYDSSEKD
ncbi:MAG: hypothetical protein ACI4G1_00650 [Ruminococcus sp.]